MAGIPWHLHFCGTAPTSLASVFYFTRFQFVDDVGRRQGPEPVDAGYAVETVRCAVVGNDETCSLCRVNSAHIRVPVVRTFRTESVVVFWTVAEPPTRKSWSAWPNCDRDYRGAAGREGPTLYPVFDGFALPRTRHASDANCVSARAFRRLLNGLREQTAEPRPQDIRDAGKVARAAHPFQLGDIERRLGPEERLKKVVFFGRDGP